MHAFDILKNKKLIAIDDKPQIYDNGVTEHNWRLSFEGDCNFSIYNNRKH